MDPQCPPALAFAPAEDVAPQAGAQADRACFGFPQRFLEQARELNECRRQLQDAWQERDRIRGFVVRNLITLADNCTVALAQAGPAPSAENLEGMTLASLQRGVLHLLEELDVYRIDLLGHTYEDVFVAGEKIEDPFVVEEAAVKGQAAVVREVVVALWVRQSAGTVEVLQRGRVLC